MNDDSVKAAKDQARTLLAGNGDDASLTEAMTLLDRAIDVDSSDPECWFLRGQLQARGKEPTASLDSYERALELDPELVACWIAKGTALTKHHRYEEAISCFKRATELKPDQAEARYLRGVALLAMDRLEEASDQVRRALELREQQLSWWLTLVEIDVKRQELQAVESHISRLAEIARQVDGEAMVIDDLRSQIDRDPAEPQHRLNLASLLAHLER